MVVNFATVGIRERERSESRWALQNSKLRPQPCESVCIRFTRRHDLTAMSGPWGPLSNFLDCLDQFTINKMDRMQVSWLRNRPRDFHLCGTESRSKITRHKQQHPRTNSALVDLSTVARAKDKNKKLLFMNFVDDSVVARPNPPLARTTNEARCSWGPGILGK